MELALPIMALGSLYFISNQQQQQRQPVNRNNLETFATSNPRQTQLPNVDIPSKNYPDDSVSVYDLDRTSNLSRQDLNSDGKSESVYTDRFFDKNQSDREAPVELPLSLTGEQVSENYYQHGNMVPYFGGKIRGLGVNDNSYESQMDTYTGAGSQQISKKEQSPLFEPLNSNQNQNGMYNSSEFIQERVAGNVSSRMDGVRPFEQENIAPGLGLGSDTNNGSKDGYNNTMMMRETWQNKNVDELRVSSKPKASEYSLIGYETAPHSSVQNMAVHGIQEKNRPETSFEMGSDRLFTSLGAFGAAATVQPELVQKYVNRNETDINSSYTGNAGCDVEGQYSTDGKYLDPHKQQLGAIPLTSVAATGRLVTENEFGTNGFNVLPNARSANAAGDSDSYFGIFGGTVRAIVTPVIDVFKPTRKTQTQNMRVYGVAKGVEKGYIFDSNNVKNQPGVTNRQYQSIDGLSRPNINRGQDGTAYKVSALSFNKTARDTQLTEYKGGAGSGSQPNKPASYKSNYAQHNNETKSSTLSGYTPGGNAAYFNNDSGLTRMKPEDSNVSDNRELVSSRRGLPPSMDQLGHSSDLKDSDKTWEIYNKDRNSKDLLLAFLDNPYTTQNFSQM